MNMNMKQIKKLLVTMGFLLSSSSAFATFIDAEAHYGVYNKYSGELQSSISSTNKSIDGSMSDMGASFHLYPIPLIPVGIGFFGSVNNFESITGNVLKEGYELYSYSAKPSTYLLGLELAVNAPLAIFIDPYVRAGGGILGGTTDVTFTSGTNPVTEALSMTNKSLTVKDYEAAGIFWQGLVGLKFKFGVPFFRLGIEAGYRNIMSMAIGDAESISSATLDVSKVTAIDKVPVVAIYENIGGYFGRIGLIFDL